MKETGFYLQDSSLGVGWGGGCCWGHPCSEPCSPTRPSTFLAPHQATNQKHNRKFPISLSVLKPAAQTSLHPLWKAHLWVAELPSSHSSSPLQDVGYVVLSLHVVVQGNMCRVALGHGAVQGGTCPKRVDSPYILQRSRNLQLSIPSHSSAPNIFHESMLG